MSRYIDADLLQEDFKADHGGKRSLMIDTQPTADVRENVRGKWERKAYGLYCTACYCGWDFLTGVPGNVESEYNFCPNCGAQMRTADSEQYSILAEGGNE